MDDVIQDTDKTVGVRCSDISKTAKEAVFVSTLAVKLILPGEHFNGFKRWTCYSV